MNYFPAVAPAGMPDMRFGTPPAPWPAATTADHFALACGVRLPLQFQLEDSDRLTSEVRAMPQAFVRIGSHPTADIQVTAENIKNCHAYLQPLAGRIFGMLFTGPAQATCATRLKRWVWLKPAQMMRVGTVRFRLVREPSTRQMAPPAADWNPFWPVNDPQTLLPRLVLTARQAGLTHRWQLDRPLALVGSSVDAAVRLRDRSLAGFECSLVHTAVGVWAVDLLGNRITLVNGQPFQAVRLQEGDELSIGDFVLTAHYDDPLPEISGISLPLVNRALPPLPQQGQLAPTDVHLLTQQFASLQQHLFEQFNQTMMLMFQMFNTLRQDQMQVLRQDMLQIQHTLQEVHALATVAQAPKGAAPAPQIPANSPAPVAPRASTVPPLTPPPPKPLPPEVKSDQEIHAWLCQRLSSIQHESQSRWKSLLDYILGKR